MPRGYKRIDYKAIAASYPKDGKLTGEDFSSDQLYRVLGDIVKQDLHQSGLRVGKEKNSRRLRDATEAEFLESLKEFWELCMINLENRRRGR